MKAEVMRRHTPADANIKEGIIRFCMDQYDGSKIRIKRDHWIPDDQINFCMNRACHVVFTLTRRKHHCRSCGKIYCSSCTSYRLPVDENGHFSDSGKYAKACVFCSESHGKNVKEFARIKTSTKKRLETKPKSIAVGDLTGSFLKLQVSPLSFTDKTYQPSSISSTPSTNHGVRELNKSAAESDEYSSSYEESSGGYVFNSGLVASLYNENNEMSGGDGVKKYNEVYRNNRLGRGSIIDSVEQSNVLSHYHKRLDINSNPEWSWSSF